MGYKYIKAKSVSYGAKRSRNDVTWIVFHYTGNVGDSAKNNVDFFHNGNTRNAGAHFFVDQNGKVYKSIAMNRIAWSVGGYVTEAYGAASLYKKCTNSNSVSIELCDCANRDPSDAMIKAVKKLIKYIRKYCPNAKNVARHWDCSGKSCPARMTGATNVGRKRWADFLQAIGESSATLNTGVIVKKSSLVCPTVTLEYGDTGSQVKNLQRCLNCFINAGLKIDGSFGNATKSAVKRFQKKYGLEVDGICGPKTRAKIKSLI